MQYRSMSFGDGRQIILTRSNEEVRISRSKLPSASGSASISSDTSTTGRPGCLRSQAVMRHQHACALQAVRFHIYCALHWYRGHWSVEDLTCWSHGSVLIYNHPLLPIVKLLLGFTNTVLIEMHVVDEHVWSRWRWIWKPPHRHEGSMKCHMGCFFSLKYGAPRALIFAWLGSFIMIVPCVLVGT